MFPQYSSLNFATAPALAAILVLGLTACGGPSEPVPAAAVPAPATEQTASNAAAEGAVAADDEAAALAAREQELADQEAELALREREAELARREAELAAREAAVKAPAKATTPPKTAATPRPATSAPSAAAVAPAPPPPVTVPTGTQFTAELTSPLSTKTSLADDPVEARLASDLMVGGRRVATAGSMVRGSLREVTSGSRKIGAVPALRIDFNQLVVADGSTVAIDARAVQEGQSEKARDTAKIVGGTAAGAIIGHQIDDDKGKVIGGLLGGAAGAVAAHKTGTEVELAAGSTLTATLRADFEYKGR